MKLMTKIAIGTSVALLIGAAAAMFMFNVPQGIAKSAAYDDIARTKAVSSTDKADTAIELAQAAVNQTGALPGGASSLQEAYQDWLVVCAQQPANESQAAVKRCAMSQQQVSQQGGQRVLAIELKPVGAGFDVALFLPFGLSLDKGATLQIDDGQVTQPYRFRTCMPAGCLVPLSFDTAYMAALQKGTTLKIKAVSDDGKDTPFSVSLKGFGAAGARVGSLVK